MTTITLYKYLGKWGPFKIDTPCDYCDLTSSVLQDMMDNEFKGLNVEFEEKKWLDNWITLLLKGAWHAPIILVDGKLFHQYSKENPLFDREKLEKAVKKDWKGRIENNMADVKVYTTPTCSTCRQLKEFLKKHKIEFEEINVAADPSKAQEMIAKSGQMTVPVTDVKGTVLTGYDKKELKKALHI